MALQLPVVPPQSDAFHLAPHRIKRCTFRRLINVELGHERVYDVECLFPDRQVPIPLGDLESAMPICNSCIGPAHVPSRRGLNSRRLVRVCPADLASGGCLRRLVGAGS